MDDTIKSLFKVILAYLVLYSVIYSIESWVKKILLRNLFKKYGYHFQQYNNQSYKHSKSGNIDSACETLKIKRSDLKNMSKEELKKIFRKRAMECHPDRQGGKHEDFIKFKNAFDTVSAVL